MEFKTFRRTLLLAAVLFVPAGTSMAANLYAFGGRDIAVPSILPEGSVMSRYTFTPMQLCGKPSCDLIGVSLYNKGSVWDPVDGPDLNTNVPGLSVRLLLDGIPSSSRFKGTFSQIAEIQLFRNSTPLSDGQFASGAFNSYFLITYKDGLIASGTSSIRLTGSVTTINATCQVADQTVKLQSIAAARLNGVGTYAAVTPFNLVVAGCPRGYNRVGYSLQAVGGAVAEGSGVLPRLAGSTATGVSIRVTDEAGVPLRMGLSLPVTAYDKNTGGAYWIPMKASYVQTAEKITPGSVLAAMVILLDYQ